MAREHLTPATAQAVADTLATPAPGSAGGPDTEPGSSPAALETAAAAWIGRVLGNQFCIQDLLGAGGMGLVFGAEQLNLARPVVVKVLHAEALGDPAAVARFEREARAVAQLAHENIVQLYLLGKTEAGERYLVMERVPGESLARLLEREPRLAIPRALTIAIQVTRALAEAHAAGIVHRDLKPPNIMIAPSRGRERVKVLDFGIAKLLGDDGPRLTAHGAALGTPLYMAPEQLAAQPVDARCDLFALGIVLYQMLTGALPFEARTLYEYGAKVMREPAVPPSQRFPGLDLPAELETLVLRCLARQPGDRPASAEAVLADLERIAAAYAHNTPSDEASGPRLTATSSAVPARQPAPARRRVPGRALILGALIAVGLAAWWASRSDDHSTAARDASSAGAMATPLEDALPSLAEGSAPAPPTALLTRSSEAAPAVPPPSSADAREGTAESPAASVPDATTHAAPLSEPASPEEPTSPPPLSTGSWGEPIIGDFVLVHRRHDGTIYASAVDFETVVATYTQLYAPPILRDRTAFFDLEGDRYITVASLGEGVTVFFYGW